MNNIYCNTFVHIQLIETQIDIIEASYRSHMLFFPLHQSAPAPFRIHCGQAVIEFVQPALDCHRRWCSRVMSIKLTAAGYSLIGLSSTDQWGTGHTQVQPCDVKAKAISSALDAIGLGFRAGTICTREFRPEHCSSTLRRRNGCDLSHQPGVWVMECKCKCCEHRLWSSTHRTPRPCPHPSSLSSVSTDTRRIGTAAAAVSQLNQRDDWRCWRSQASERPSVSDSESRRCFLVLFLNKTWTD